MVKLDPSARIRPSCMDDADWAGWVRLDDMIGKDWLQAPSPCEDCDAAFAAEMGARCNGKPGVRLIVRGRPRSPIDLSRDPSRDTSRQASREHWRARNVRRKSRQPWGVELVDVA